MGCMFPSGCSGERMARCSKPWKRLNGGIIHLSSRIKDRPDRDRLALRFERFKAVA